MTIITSEGVALVDRINVGENVEIRAYFQPHKGVIKAHIRFVTVNDDGGVGYTTRGIAVDPELLDKLLRAVALLAAERGVLGV
ncbi:MAG: hypothetical protein M3364_00135 [Actinomycetota bacterium]|nr:hypothetical protein [Actinomycetota bacterium]